MPLFPFVWQYNNQPIEVLAQDIAELAVNTAEFIPVSTGTAFIDSPLQVRPDGLFGVFNGNDTGMYIDYVNNQYMFGDDTGTVSARLSINGDLAVVNLAATNGINPNVFLGIDGINKFLTCNGVSDTVAGASSGKYIKIEVDGILYNIELLNDN
jgi:hypothetical protein